VSSWQAAVRGSATRRLQTHGGSDGDVNFDALQPADTLPPRATSSPPRRLFNASVPARRNLYVASDRTKVKTMG